MSTITANPIAILAALDQEIAASASALNALSPAQLAARPNAAEWSCAQVMHHMADSCMVNAIRTRLLLTEANPRYGGYDERLWTALPDANQPAVDESIAILRGVHARWAMLLPSLSDAEWARTLTHSATDKVTTLADIMEHYVEHARLHIAQLRALQTESPAPQAAAAQIAGGIAAVNDERAALVAKIGALPQQLEALVGHLTTEQLVARPLAGEWSVAQNVHHLADAHMNSFVRCKLVLAEDLPTFKPYNQEAWAELPDADSAVIGPSLDLLRGLHARWVRLWLSLSDMEWAHGGMHPEGNRIYTLADILRTYGGHGEAHLDQIRRTLAASE